MGEPQKRLIYTYTQLSAVGTRSNIAHIIAVAGTEYESKIESTKDTNGWAMVYLLWEFWRKLTALKWHRTVYGRIYALDFI